MRTIISANDLLAMTPEAKSMSTAELIDLINARLLHARSQGASCIVMKAEDGFVLFHPDRTEKPLPEHAISVLRALDGAGYIFVKDTTPSQVPCLKVYFGDAPYANRVRLVELENWALATASPELP